MPLGRSPGEAAFGAIEVAPVTARPLKRADEHDVRFTPNSDRESEIPQKAMSALPPKADMCSARHDVR